MRGHLPLLLMRSPHLVKIVGQWVYFTTFEKKINTLSELSSLKKKKKKSRFVHRMINPKILTFPTFSLGESLASFFLLMGQYLFTLHFYEAETVVLVDRYNKVAIAAL